MYRKLLVACDGSEGSQIAVVHASILAKKLDAQLSALWVRGYLPHYPESVGEIAEEEEAALEFFEEIQAQLSSIAVAQGVVIQANLRSGHPAQQIVALAQESSVDLIVLGNRGHSRLWGELLGHTADRVNEHAPCSVLIVRSKKEVDDRPSPPPLTIKNRPGSVARILAQLCRQGSSLTTQFSLPISQSRFSLPHLGRKPR